LISVGLDFFSRFYSINIWFMCGLCSFTSLCSLGQKLCHLFLLSSKWVDSLFITGVGLFLEFG